MDPFSSLSLASAVVQFICFGAKLFASSRELYQAANAHDAATVELQIVVQDLNQLSGDLGAQVAVPQPPQASKDERSLKALALSCKSLSDELKVVLEDLAVEGKHKKFQSFRQALRSVWKEKEIKEMETRLDTYRNQLTLRMVAILKDQQSSVLSSMNSLSDQLKSMDIGGTTRLEDLRRDLLSALQSSQAQTTATREFGFISSRMSTLFTQCHAVSKEQRILESLRFRAFNLRHERVVDAHDSTFSWMFETHGPQEHPRHDFVPWLKCHDGVYWISGKAGSGKSTLMKYICGSPHTRKALEEWAEDKQLVIGKFFFWNSGTDLEKSQEGLFRSLLYHVISQLPRIIPTLVPKRWQSLNLSSIEPWTRSELLEALSNLATANLTDVKCCYFVDGLDEYDGSHSDLIDVLERMSKSRNIKLCVSSRPWAVFEKAFGGSPDRSLRVQDFTRGDIQRYVIDNFSRVLRVSEANLRSSDYKSLVQKIVDDAKGVFLWVFLAVKYLSDGFTNEDTMAELHQRLEILPPDLETFYSHMLDSIDPFYRVQAAHILLVCLRAKEPVDAITLSFVDGTEPRSALDAEVRTVTREELTRLLSQVRTRINARCKDLMEVHLNSYGYRVDFLHRTVKDFLLTPEMQAKLKSRVSSSFDADASLCSALLGNMKLFSSIVDGALEVKTPIGTLVRRFMSQAFEANLNLKPVDPVIFHEVDRVLAEYGSLDHSLDTLAYLDFGKGRPYKRGMILHIAVAKGVKHFWKSEIEKDRSLANGAGGLPLLPFALGLRDDGRWYGANLDSLKALLDLGADPNHALTADESVWTRFVCKIYWWKVLGWTDPGRLAQQARAAKLFVAHGASLDPKVSVPTGKRHSVLHLLQMVFDPDTVLEIRGRP